MGVYWDIESWGLFWEKHGILKLYTMIYHVSMRCIYGKNIPMIFGDIPYIRSILNIVSHGDYWDSVGVMLGFCLDYIGIIVELDQ